MNTIKSIKDELEYKLARCELSSNDPNAHVILTLDELREVIKEFDDVEERCNSAGYDAGCDEENTRCCEIRDRAEDLIKTDVEKAIKVLGEI